MESRVKRIPRQFAHRGRGVKAAYRPFKPGGGGSSPSGPTCTSSAAEHSPYKGATRGSIPPAPTDVDDRIRAACSSRAEHSADNRKTKVRLLPGRLGRTNEKERRDQSVSGSIPWLLTRRVRVRAPLVPLDRISAALVV